MNREEMMAKAPLGKLIFKLSIPTICAQLINALYNIVDRIYLGHIKDMGGIVLTSVGLTFPIILLISAFSNLIGSGGAPLAAIALGSGNKKKANDILNQGFYTLIALSIILTSFFFIFKKPMLYAFGASDITYVHANEYISTYLIGTIFVQLCLGLNPFITAQGYSSFSMMTVIIGAVFNIILDPIFIFILNLGAKGAALATIISQAISCLWVLGFLTSKKSILKINIKEIKITRVVLIPILSLGVSPFIMQSTEAAINIAFNSTLSRYGGDSAVGVMTIIASIMTFCWMPLQGFSQGTQPIISFNYGANNKERVIKAFKICALISFGYAFLFFLLVETMPELFLSFFTSDKSLITSAIPYARIYFFGLCIFGFQNAIQNTFVGLGQAKKSLFIALLRKVILLIPLVFILSSFLGVKGVFLAEPISDIISALSAITLFTINFKKILSKGEKK